MKSAYCYYRSKSLARKTFSWQEGRCNGFAREKGWDVTGELYELDIPDVTRMLDRTCIQILIEEAMKHAFDVLIVADMDDLGTNATELMALFRILRENDVEVFSVALDRQIDERSILDKELEKQNKTCFVCRKGKK